MSRKLRPSIIALLSLYLQVPFAISVKYTLSESIVGNAFYDKFTWFDIPDWNHGRVNYTDRETSRRLNLTYASSDTFILRSDFTTVLDPAGPGRNSVRIISKQTYTTHVAIFDVRHMPEGCGTWPAIWETKQDGWPNGGELDIVEGINNQTPNLVSVHTSPNCTMPRDRNQTGTPASLTCDGGCNVRMRSRESFGPAFNANGGGWFAVERRPDFIKVWFWPRKGGVAAPRDVISPGTSATTEAWGIPDALFATTPSCDLAAKFRENAIIINLNFCGDWAGSQYGASGCPSTCANFVNTNTAYYWNAYFDIASIRIYL
ncbi:glycoside hydrolase family 16 protein [Coprinopsis marcescibilis]|uniref:Glycoside hydrolase family 16 protein n=1 Tax=Coprinopsis marcescibilis TaxID=230819 RepID=A0A5C3KPM3_COPMA|nr:glycoside hydrolase family 16 protein [Coprinopsis marcescibilis]